ncbi:MAG: hypothetical protein LBF83_10205 [Spirochaetaceae bacterium]|jgi:hypothetical protein|nr:hypothetical protein [Spirochaetaceae bacterium]
MTVFLLKKTFFDLWDNAFRVALLNIGFIASLVFFLLLNRLLEVFSPLPSAVSGLIFLLAAAWYSVYLAAAALCVKNISDYSYFGFADFWAALRSVWKAGIVFSLFFCAGALLFTFIIPFYLLLNNPAGLLVASLLFWTFVLLAAMFQYFFAVRARLGVTVVKVIKKCFLLFIDNPFFFAGTMLLALLLLVLSAVTAFLLPGPAGVLLFLDEALRLRLLKYDWLEQNGDADRRYIPWNKVLAEEYEKTGRRTIRGLLFPWKD